MISYYIDSIVWGFEIMVPNFEGLEYCEELFVVSIIIKLCSLKCTAIESHWVYFAIVSPYRKDTHDCIVGGIGFDDGQKCGVEMYENRGRSKRVLQ